MKSKHKMYFKYFKYVFRHKYYVMKECFKMGLYWQGIVHDLSKFLPSEAKAYANFFSGDNENKSLFAGKFKYAWLYHQKRNKHHWQYWVLLEDVNRETLLKIPTKYLKEMLCDWIGAGLAIHGKKDIHKWYEMNKSKIRLHDESRQELEKYLVDIK